MKRKLPLQHASDDNQEKKKRLLFFRRIKPVDWLKALLSIVVLALLIILSSLFENVVIGQVGIVIYGVYALTFRVATTTTFALGIISLFFTLFLHASDPGGDLADTFAVYTYMLLAFGMISAFTEEWRHKERHSKKHYIKSSKILRHNS